MMLLFTKLSFLCTRSPTSFPELNTCRCSVHRHRHPKEGCRSCSRTALKCTWNYSPTEYHIGCLATGQICLKEGYEGGRNGWVRHRGGCQVKGRFRQPQRPDHKGSIRRSCRWSIIDIQRQVRIRRRKQHDLQSSPIMAQGDLQDRRTRDNSPPRTDRFYITIWRLRSVAAYGSQASNLR